jgi:hypothetical protein
LIQNNNGEVLMTRITRFYGLFTAVLAIAAMNTFLPQADAQTWDFQYTYQNVFQANAMDYVVEQSNIQRIDERAGISYWCPIANGTEARLTQEFIFPEPTLHLSLDARIDTWDFGGGNYGFGSLWGSTDGTTWVQLMDAPTPSFNATYRYATQVNPPNDQWAPKEVPASLEGTTQFWLQIRLETSGMDILAQFGRSASLPLFELDANYVTVPEPSSALLTLGGLALFLVRRMTAFKSYN